MPELSAPILERANKIHTLILRRLSQIGQANVAKAMNRHESTVSRLKSDEGLREFCALLAAMGMKVIPEHHQAYSPRLIQSMQYLSRAYLSHVDIAQAAIEPGDNEIEGGQ